MKNTFTALFSLGQLTATPGALAALATVGQPFANLVKRHVSGDWGELDEADRRENELSLKHGDRLLSSYGVAPGLRVWIITEADRSATTLLLPEEY
ncbi:MAG: hypothetical protein ACRYFS_15235 [Janthinobacterium lividum]